jgi:putative MATE family efflux protein
MQKGMYMSMQTVKKGGYQELWVLAYPNIVSMMLHNLLLIVDTLMIGMIGTVALAGVGLAQLILATLFHLHKGLADGVLTLTAQYVGARQEHRCGVVLWQGLYVGGAITLLIVSMIPLVGSLFWVMRPAPEAVSVGVSYMQVALIGESLVPLSLVLSYFLRGLGNTKTPMRITLVGNGLNIIGNYLLIFGHGGLPRLGVVGAALATTIAEGIVLGLLLWACLRQQVSLRCETRRIVSPEKAEMRRLGKIALPLSLQGGLEVGSFMVFAAMIGRMGTDQLALNHIILRLIVFVFLPVQGLALAASTLVGQYLGARDTGHAEDAGRRAIHLGVAYMGGLGVLFVAMPHTFLSFFTDDLRVMTMGITVLRLLGLVQAGDALYWVCSGVLKGAGDSRWILLASAIYNWLIFLPLAFVFGIVLEGGVLGAWGACAAMMLFQGLTFWRRFQRGAWKDVVL